MKKQSGSVTQRSMIGLGLIVIAFLMLFNNLGFHFVGKLIGHWPIALIVIGGVMLYGPFEKNRDNATRGKLPYFLIGFGLLFFLAQHHFFNFSFAALIGPVILLAIGVHILKPDTKKNKSKHCGFEGDAGDAGDGGNSNIIEGEWVDEDEQICSANTDSCNGDNENRIDVFNFLGGSEFSTSSKNLSGGNVVCVLGGADIDIREADTQSDTIEIEVIAFMGGAEIKVPHHWQVSVKVIPFLGGVGNKTTCIAEKLNLPKRRVIISGLAFMGGIDVRN